MRYEIVVEIDSEFGRELVSEIFDQMLDDYGFEDASLAVMEVQCEDI